MSILKKRLNLEIPVKIHDELKSLAALYNITITKLVLREIIRLIARRKIEK